MPARPAELYASNWRAALGSARVHIKRDRVNVAAGAFAYRWFIALFPALIALLGVASLIAVPRPVTLALVHGVERALPPAAASVIASAIAHASRRSNGALSASATAALVALWSATSGMVMVEEGLDMAYEVPGDRSFGAKRVLALPLLAGATVLGGAASALVVFGPQLGPLIERLVPVAGPVFSAGWAVLRWTVALVLMSLLFSLLYHIAPNRERGSWQWASPGALLGTAVWAAVSAGFSFYTTTFGSYGKTYGAFAGVVVLIFWLYLTGLAVLLGGEVNAAFEREGGTPASGEVRAA